MEGGGATVLLKLPPAFASFCLDAEVEKGGGGGAGSSAVLRNLLP